MAKRIILAVLVVCLLAIASGIALFQAWTSPFAAGSPATGEIGAQPITVGSQPTRARPQPTPGQTEGVTVVPQPAPTDNASGGSPTVTPEVAATIPVPVSSFYWGAHIDGAPFDMQKVEDFENTTGRPLNIIHWGQPWVWGGKVQDFPTAAMDAVHSHGSIPMLDWASWDLSNGVNQPTYRLSAVYSGKYDEYLRKWALAAKNWGHPLFLRFNWEMNGWWFPWSEQLNGNQPGDYVKAWRHVHDIFTSVGATNVVWVWSPNVAGNPRLTPLSEVWPGDKYVDWVGMDGFNWGSDDGSYWVSFADVFQYTYGELSRLVPDKPFMIGEVASSENGGPQGKPASKAAWIRDMFAALPNFPRIKAVIWYNSLDNHPEHSWPLTSSPEAIRAFREADIAEPQFSASAEP